MKFSVKLGWFRCVDRTLPPTEGPVGDASKRSRLERIYKGHHAPPKTGLRIETDEIRVDGLIGQRRMVISGFMYLSMLRNMVKSPNESQARGFAHYSMVKHLECSIG